MTEEQKVQTQKLRTEGYGYTKISKMLGLSENTIKSYCHRKGLGGVAAKKVVVSKDEEKVFCLCCGIEVEQNPGRKRKKFCSDRCRNKWWNSHLEQVDRKAHYDFVCEHCKKPFTSYGNKHRKYCSHECYVADRFGGIE